MPFKQVFLRALSSGLCCSVSSSMTYSSLSKYCKHILYADDLQIYIHCYPQKQLEQAVNKVRDDIAAIELWAGNNSLRLNPHKIKVTLIGTARHLNNIDTSHEIEFKIDGLPIEFTNQVTNLCSLHEYFRLV